MLSYSAPSSVFLSYPCSAHSLGHVLGLGDPPRTQKNWPWQENAQRFKPPAGPRSHAPLRKSQVPAAGPECQIPGPRLPGPVVGGSGGALISSGLLGLTILSPSSFAMCFLLPSRSSTWHSVSEANDATTHNYILFQQVFRIKVTESVIEPELVNNGILNTNTGSDQICMPSMASGGGQVSLLLHCLQAPLLGPWGCYVHIHAVQVCRFMNARTT